MVRKDSFLSGFEVVNHLTTLLYNKGLIGKFAHCIPTLSFFNSTMTLINEGKTKEALSAIASCEHVLFLFENDLSEKEIDWYSGIIRQLKQGVASCTPDVHLNSRFPYQLQPWQIYTIQTGRN